MTEESRISHQRVTMVTAENEPLLTESSIRGAFQQQAVPIYTKRMVDA